MSETYTTYRHGSGEILGASVMPLGPITHELRPANMEEEPIPEALAREVTRLERELTEQIRFNGDIARLEIDADQKRRVAEAERDEAVRVSWALANPICSKHSSSGGKLPDPECKYCNGVAWLDYVCRGIVEQRDAARQEAEALRSELQIKGELTDCLVRFVDAAKKRVAASIWCEILVDIGEMNTDGSPVQLDASQAKEQIPAANRFISREMKGRAVSSASESEGRGGEGDSAQPLRCPCWDSNEWECDTCHPRKEARRRGHQEWLRGLKVGDAVLIRRTPGGEEKSGRVTGLRRWRIIAQESGRENAPHIHFRKDLGSEPLDGIRVGPIAWLVPPLSDDAVIALGAARGEGQEGK